MPRSSSFRAALAGLLTLGFALGPALGPALSPAAAAAEEDTDPLVVHLDTITPALPRSGDVEVSGTVTNVSDETYTRVNLHVFSSAAPILSAQSLVDSASNDPNAYVGDRVTEPGTFDTVDELAPGETAEFSDSVPVDLLPAADEDGVYWIGVHALGDSETVPRDEVADGRARTFIPRRPSGSETQEASVILSIRSRVWFADDGSVAGTARWARRLAEDGSLDAALDMADSAGATPHSFLVDPAVLLALSRLASGNPPRSLAPDPTVPGQEPTPTETPSEGTGTETPETSETLTPTQPQPTEAPDGADADLAAAASAWLARFTALVGPDPVLTLPFGDLDVSAAIRHDPGRLEEATARSAEVMTALALPSRPAVSPAGDVLSPDALAALPADTVVLLGDNAFAEPPTTPNSVVRLLGHDVVVTSTGAESGGPAPTAANDPLALRQRLLSEAALRLLDDDTAPLVVTLPTVWRGEDAASFFTDLEQPWLDVVPVGEVADRSPKGVKASTLSYTDEDAQGELDASAFIQASRASATATVLEQVLTLVTTVESQVRDEVLVTLSEQHRDRPRMARAAARRTDTALRAYLAKIRIEAPTAVTLSSDSGKLGATLVNGLDQPVEVQVEATTDGELTLTGGGSRQLGPKARSVVRYEATTTQAGVHTIRLAVTSLDGTPLGSYDQLPIRAARVSALIWFVMAGGALVLFGMIGYRLPGQIRQRRAELRAAETGGETGGEPGADPAADASAPAGRPVTGEPAVRTVPERP